MLFIVNGWKRGLMRVTVVLVAQTLVKYGQSFNQCLIGVINIL